MTETASRPGRRGWVPLVLSCASLVLSLMACGAVGLVIASDDLDLLPVQRKPQVASAGQVEAVAHVTLPPGTVLLGAAYSGGLEIRLSAKFRMPRSELDAFIADAGFDSEPLPGLRAVSAEHNVGGGNLWEPETAATVSGIEETRPDGTYRAVLFNLDDPNTVTVYMYASRN